MPYYYGGEHTLERGEREKEKRERESRERISSTRNLRTNIDMPPAASRPKAYRFQ
jgi:hypothetical protein